MIPLIQNPPTKFKKKNFYLNYMTPLVITGFEQLSSSKSAAELWLAKVCPERENYAFSEKFWNRPKTGYLTHNFVYRYARKSIKGSTDADFDLIFKKILSQKNGSMGWGPGPAKGWQNFQNTFSLWRHLQKPPPKTKNVFFDFDYKTCWIRGWFG